VDIKRTLMTVESGFFFNCYAGLTVQTIVGKIKRMHVRLFF